jgi:hypothetical protein
MPMLEGLPPRHGIILYVEGENSRCGFEARSNFPDTATRRDLKAHQLDHSRTGVTTNRERDRDRQLFPINVVQERSQHAKLISSSELDRPTIPQAASFLRSFDFSLRRVRRNP